MPMKKGYKRKTGALGRMTKTTREKRDVMMKRAKKAVTNARKKK